MFILSRGPGQSILIDDLEVSVGWIRFNKVQLLIEDPETETPAKPILYLNEKIELAIGISIIVIQITAEKARLGIESPPGTQVTRSELV
ncbi:carbon storage regulator [Gimesia alba]|uniref:Carbon storage regulator n=1 Tax=Gimesia alba TaxID=2527973 RepID=A0A517RPR4_9PLAN|nr:carbon storage regulator [Gimesia alba]QDT45868.1 carbon storage regulator [Gimesia alba]